jgi:5'-3' exonuclease
MGLKIRDEGIEKLLEIYKTAVTVPFLQDGTYNKRALLQLFQAVREKEPLWIRKGIQAKRTARSFCKSRDAGEIAVSKWNDLPIVWDKDACLVQEQVQEHPSEKPTYVLRDDWPQIYDKEALWGADPNHVAKLYLESLAWTFAYYRGQPVDMHWYYPWPLPPRTDTIVQVLQRNHTIETPALQRDPIQPLEQLAMVLPQSSFHLLPKEYAQLPAQYPYAWPQAWASYSLGRRFLWECEPLIPLISPTQIKKWIETLYET